MRVILPSRSESILREASPASQGLAGRYDPDFQENCWFHEDLLRFHRDLFRFNGDLLIVHGI